MVGGKLGSCLLSVTNTRIDFRNKLRHQSIPAAPRPPWATAGHLPALSVSRKGHLQIFCSPGAGHLPTPGLLQSFGTYAISDQNITTKRISLAKQAYSLICQKKKKLKRVVKACQFSILCMHFFIAYQNRITN